ncbi:fructan 6-exohydrolase-like [Mangifera indica]|uniref:fructan 6-exohydrolase-like n=1 Tax=Mangifera indica TaxID=29780 RepID=UPI001CF9CA38|nr:fructan 6-exohydrolase-like [Mangifera indica]
MSFVLVIKKPIGFSNAKPTMASSCVSLVLLLFTLLLGHGLFQLEASKNACRNTHTAQPYRTSYHFQPAMNWMNDPNAPMIYKGIYHLFYQYNPQAAVWNASIVWAHSTSTDLINWTPHDPAMYPSQPSDINGCWSGSATVLPGGEPAILYTGISSNNKQVQNLAVPKNSSDPYLTEWVKSAENPLMEPPENIDPNSFRDPATAWLGPDGTWRVVIGSEFQDKGLVFLYRSKDFVHWSKAEQPLHSVEGTGMWECVDFFPVSTDSLTGLDTSKVGPNIKHVIKASLFDTKFDCYIIGTYDVDTDKFIPEEGSIDKVAGLRYDYGKFYASKTFFDSANNRRILWAWVNESSSEADDIKKGWSGLQAIPRSLWLDKSGKQLTQWPIVEVERLRGHQVELPSKLLEEGSLLEVTGITAAQADVEISFAVTGFEKAEVLDSSLTNPQLLCSQLGSSVKGALGPFGLLVLASNDLKEYTAVFFIIFKDQDKYAVLMCSDQSRSSLDTANDKTTFGAFVEVDPVHENLSLRSLIDHSIVESFGAGGKACITARVYPALAIDEEAHLYAFNYGTEKVKITSLSAWSMKEARINKIIQQEDHITLMNS